MRGIEIQVDVDALLRELGLNTEKAAKLLEVQVSAVQEWLNTACLPVGVQEYLKHRAGGGARYLPVGSKALERKMKRKMKENKTNDGSKPRCLA